MNTSTQLLRNRFTDESIGTASPSRIVVMAYERIDRDLAGALLALDARDLAAANELLCHAQDLVTELHGMLDLDAWEHAPALASIYRFVGELLTSANVRKRRDDVESARSLLADLGSAFKQAAVVTATAPSTSAPARTEFGPDADAAPAGRASVWIQA